MEKLEFTVDEQNNKIRVDKFLSNTADLPRSYIKKCIESECLKINGSICTSIKEKVLEGQNITLELLPQEKQISLEPQNIPVEIIYEDDDIIVVNKQRGLIVHPSYANPDGTLVNALLHHTGGKLASVAGDNRPGIVHRIDKDTSGVLIVAKTNDAYHHLNKQFSEHSIKRKYQAFVWGMMNPIHGKIDVNVGRHPAKKTEQTFFANSDHGKKAITNYKTLEIFDDKDLPAMSLIDFQLETGRTHQIRVHMKYKKTPIIGDPVYSNHNKHITRIANLEIQTHLREINQQMLHAYRLEIIHPTTGKLIKFKSKLPDDMQTILDMLHQKFEGKESAYEDDYDDDEYDNYEYV